MEKTDYASIPSYVTCYRYREEERHQFVCGTYYDTLGRHLDLTFARRYGEMQYSLSCVSELHRDEMPELLWSFSLERFAGCALLLDLGLELAISLLRKAEIWHVIPLSYLFSGEAAAHRNGGLAYYVDPESSLGLKDLAQKRYPRFKRHIQPDELHYLRTLERLDKLRQGRIANARKRH